ncbi:general amidase [Metarhizium brunneum]
MHGVPVSLKDQFHVKYAETNMGCVSWVGTFEGAQGTGREFHDQSQLVEELHSLGAVLYCKTSGPQTLLLGETVNNIIDRTMNPVNRLLSCGSSSGGEGALLALGASNVGVGTDIGKHIPAKIPPFRLARMPLTIVGVE